MPIHSELAKYLCANQGSFIQDKEHVFWINFFVLTWSSPLLISNTDAALVARNQEAMEAARRKMQEELDAKAVLFREKQKQVLKSSPKNTFVAWMWCTGGTKYVFAPH